MSTAEEPGGRSDPKVVAGASTATRPSQTPDGRDWQVGDVYGTGDPDDPTIFVRVDGGEDQPRWLVVTPGSGFDFAYDEALPRGAPLIARHGRSVPMVAAVVADRLRTGGREGTP